MLYLTQGRCLTYQEESVAIYQLSLRVYKDWYNLVVCAQWIMYYNFWEFHKKIGIVVI